jgi:toxin FitB
VAAYLVDSNVLSEPTKPVPHLRVLHWLRRHEYEIAVDPIILGELRVGILGLPRSRRRDTLEQWFADVVLTIECVAWEAQTALRWAELMARLRASGQTMPFKDSLIAATALVHDLTVVTRNTADFEKAGVKLFDPFA